MMMSFAAAFSPSRHMHRVRPEPPALEYPLTPTPRVAVLGRELRRGAGILAIVDWRSRLRDVEAAEALAGSLDDLLELAAWRQQGRVTLSRLRYPLVVISAPSEGCLTAADHHQLWEAYELPVFEQIRDADNKLAAFECEARDGFHVADAGIAIPGSSAMVGPCGCGLESQRIRVPERAGGHEARQLAAITR